MCAHVCVCVREQNVNAKLGQRGRHGDFGELCLHGVRMGRGAGGWRGRQGLWMVKTLVSHNEKAGFPREGRVALAKADTPALPNQGDQPP
jgi:hypothetical protein